MSISDPKVKTVRRPLKMGPRTAVNAVADDPNVATPPPLPVPHDSGRISAASPYRTISDRGLTLMQISCDFVCACIALPLGLILLSRLSSVQVNDSGRLLANMEVDSLFPIAVVLALALGGVYRVTHRRLQPSAFLELRELSFGVGCGCVLALADRLVPARRLRHRRALRHPARHGGHRRHRRHHLRTHRPALLPSYADHDPGARRRFGHDGRSHHAERAAGTRHDPRRTCRRR